MALEAWISRVLDQPIPAGELAISTHLKAEEFFGGGNLLPVSQAGSEPQAREAEGESDQDESESDGEVGGFHGIFLKRDHRLNRGG